MTLEDEIIAARRAHYGLGRKIGDMNTEMYATRNKEFKAELKEKIAELTPACDAAKAELERLLKLREEQERAAEAREEVKLLVWRVFGWSLSWAVALGILACLLWGATKVVMMAVGP